MKLTWRIVLRISLLMSLVLALWAVLIHRSVIDEVNDETDDSLEFFTENLINRVLQGEELPAANNGTNNTFFWESVSDEYARTHPHVEYSNEVVYIKEQDDHEPARVLRTIFLDGQGDYHMITVATPTIDTDDLREALTYWIVTLYVALLLIMVVVCVWVLWRTMRPLYRILRWLDSNDISKGVQPLDNPTRVGEFMRLNQAVVRSAQRSEQLYNQQRQFTGNASHEIQTPLAICRNRLDLLLATTLSEEQMGEVIGVQQSLEHISRLNRELLLLAKIDGGQFVQSEHVDMVALVTKIASDCAMIYGSGVEGVEVNTAEPMEISMNPTLATVLVSNLVKNAFLHNVSGGGVIVALRGGVLCVSNGGDEQLDDSKIFERFYQGSKREGSTGLGLALVRSISELYDFELRYEFIDGRHIFLVKFC